METKLSCQEKFTYMSVLDYFCHYTENITLIFRRVIGMQRG